MDKFFANNKNKKFIYVLYATIMVFGIGFMITGSFHNALWFDETYTVGLINHSFIDLIKISTFDVHPYLYYILLKIFTLIFGKSIVAMRIFSALGAVALASVGFTHIRRDFGEKTGIYYTIISFLMPVVFKYAQQIRMYTWVAYFLILACIYAYRYFKNPNKENFVKFILFSVLASYTHYFAFFASLLIDAMFFVYYLKHKELKQKWLKIIKYQLIFYSIGLAVLLLQLIRGGAAWISMQKDIYFEILAFNFVGDLSVDSGYSGRILYAISFLSLCIFVLLGIFLYNLRKKSKERAEAPILALCVYFGVIFATMLISIVKPVFYPRYMTVMVGIFIFVFAYALGNLENKLKWFKYAFLVFLLVLSVLRASEIYKISYNETSNLAKEYAQTNIDENDIIITDEGLIFQFSVFSPKTLTCMYNSSDWDIQKPYNAFANEVKVAVRKEDLKECISKGQNRIFVINSKDCEEIVKETGLYEFERRDNIFQTYYSCNFDIAVYKRIK